MSIRSARPEDLDAIISLIRELAAYERLSAEVVLDPTTLERHLFGTRPAAEVLVAEEGAGVVGFALFFHNFSTFLGKPGIYLEDLFVRPEARGQGHGKALLATLAKLAVARDCGRLEWAVLDWNAPALGFYQALGAKSLDDWRLHRLTGEALRSVAQRAP